MSWNLFTTFTKAQKRKCKKAEEIANIMEEEFLKPEKVNGTRWIDHKLRATWKLLRNWVVTVCHLENYASDTKNRGEDRATAKGILNKMLQYKFVWYIHFLRDVLNELQCSYYQFSFSERVSSAISKLQVSELVLQNLIGNRGQCIRDFYNKAEVQHDADTGRDRHIFIGHSLSYFIPNETLERQKKMRF